jgi:Peptidase M15
MERSFGFIQRAVITVVFAACIALTSGTTAHAKIAGNNGVGRRVASLLNQVSAHFHRPVVIISGCRSLVHNRRIGGARESYHLRCMAADFRVPGVGLGKVYRYAASLPGRGGVGTYCHESFMHIDIGPRREWHWGCGKRKGKHAKKYHHRHRRMR